MSSEEEDDLSQTEPRRGLPPETPRTGALVLLGNGTPGRACGRRAWSRMEELILDIGRRPAAAPAGGPAGPATLALPDSTVSSLHARIQRATCRTDLFIIQDLGSTNGTHVDGRLITGPVPLRDGAVLFLGSQALVFRLYTVAELEAMKEDAAAPFAPVPTFSPELAVIAARLRRLAPSGSEILFRERPASARTCSRTRCTASRAERERCIAINCAAIPRELVESELFGYEKGAHSTAQSRKVGLVELADGGTLFLDELGEMPPSCRPSFCAFCRIAASRRSDRRASSRPTSASSPPPAASTLQMGRARAGGRARAAWARSPSCCRRCASASRTSAGWWRIS